MKYLKAVVIVLILLLLYGSYGCNQNKVQSKADTPKYQVKPDQADSIKSDEKSQVTFIELGSITCIPCKLMQPVMEAIEKEFDHQIEVVFHDVWKDPEPGRKYGIRLIPTQVFLDDVGKEFFRHEGYFPKEDIEKLLVEKGLKILKQVDIEK